MVTVTGAVPAVGPPRVPSWDCPSVSCVPCQPLPAPAPSSSQARLSPARRRASGQGGKRGRTRPAPEQAAAAARPLVAMGPPPGEEVGPCGRGSGQACSEFKFKFRVGAGPGPLLLPWGRSLTIPLIPAVSPGWNLEFDLRGASLSRRGWREGHSCPFKLWLRGKRSPEGSPSSRPALSPSASDATAARTQGRWALHPESGKTPSSTPAAPKLIPILHTAGSYSRDRRQRWRRTGWGAQSSSPGRGLVLAHAHGQMQPEPQAMPGSQILHLPSFRLLG